VTPRERKDMPWIIGAGVCVLCSVLIYLVSGPKLPGLRATSNAHVYHHSDLVHHSDGHRLF
jgi:hypothetical protein